MDLDVYCCDDGKLLLVPGCFEPSLRARHRHGSLRLMGAVSMDDSPPWQDIFEEIDARSYALVADTNMAVDLLTGPGFHRMPATVGPAGS